MRSAAARWGGTAWIRFSNMARMRRTIDGLLELFGLIGARDQAISAYQEVMRMQL